MYIMLFLFILSIHCFCLYVWKKPHSFTFKIVKSFWRKTSIFVFVLVYNNICGLYSWKIAKTMLYPLSWSITTCSDAIHTSSLHVCSMMYTCKSNNYVLNKSLFPVIFKTWMMAMWVIFTFFVIKIWKWIWFIMPSGRNLHIHGLCLFLDSGFFYF